MNRFWCASLFFFLLLQLSAETNIPFLEETPGNKKGAFYTIEGAIVGTPLTVDDSFAAEHGGPRPGAPFRIIVPKGQNRKMAAGSGGGEILSIGYSAADGSAREILRLTGLTVPMRSPEDRIQILADLLIKQGPGLAFTGWAKGKFEGIYVTRIGDRYDAVTMQGWCSDPEKGYYFVRLCGIINPIKDAGVLAYVLIDPKLTGIEPGDLTSMGDSLKIIHSIKFVER